MTYFNTTGLAGEDLELAKIKAGSQDHVIYEWFKAHGQGTPSRVWRACLPNAPITSVRRSITNLTDAGLLFKTEEQRNGFYGRPEYVWEIRGADKAQQELF